MKRIASIACALAWLGAGASAQNCLTTLFTGTTSTSQGSAALFDMTVANPVLIQSISCNFTASAGTAVGLDVYVTPNTWVGNHTNQAVWTLVGSDNGSVVSAGAGQPTIITFAAPILLQPGNYGVSLVSKGATSHRYSSTGSTASYSDAHLTLNLGAMQAPPFSGGLLQPRIWNGTICYLPGSGLFPNFDATPRAGDAPLAVQFTDQSYSSAPGGVLGWAWDFDNNGTVDSNAQNPAHVYPQEGVYTVTLQVIDQVHGLASLTKNAFIEVDLCKASFTFSLTGSSSVRFTDTSAGHPTSWAWDFDSDGLVDSTQQNPAHTYPQPGVYRCTLAVADAISNDSTTLEIGVSVLPLPGFGSTFSSANLTRGYWFQTPARFSVVGLRVPDESGHGLQNVAVYRLAGPAPSYPATATSDPLFTSFGQPSTATIPCVVSFDAGDYVGVLGACGDATTMRNSYATPSGPYTSSIFGQPTTLTRFLTQTNLVTATGTGAYSQEVNGALARVEMMVSAAVGIEYGTATPANPGTPAPRLRTTRLPLLGRTAELTVDQPDPGAIGQVVVGIGRASIPTPFGTWLVANPLASAPLNGGAPMQAGSYTFQLPVPNSASLNGAGPLDWQNVNIVAGSSNLLSVSNGNEWWLAN